MFAHAEVKIAALEEIEGRRILDVVLRTLDAASVFDVGLRGRRQVGRSADDKRRDRRQFLNGLR